MLFDVHEQRLALLYPELTQAIGGTGGVDVTANMEIAEIRKHCSEIAGDVQALSHELHSSKLDYLGVVAALASFCREFSKQHDVDIEFTHKEVPDTLATDISLCFFRETANEFLLADDHPMICADFQKLLEPYYEVVGCVKDGLTLLEAVQELRLHITDGHSEIQSVVHCSPRQ